MVYSSSPLLMDICFQSFASSVKVFYVYIFLFCRIYDQFPEMKCLDPRVNSESCVKIYLFGGKLLYIVVLSHVFLIDQIFLCLFMR